MAGVVVTTALHAWRHGRHSRALVVRQVSYTMLLVVVELSQGGCLHTCEVEVVEVVVGTTRTHDHQAPHLHALARPASFHTQVTKTPTPYAHGARPAPETAHNADAA